MPGTLYLVPTTLGASSAANDPLGSLIPQQVQAITAGIDYFIAENAKSARAYLKQIGHTHRLARPIQEIVIAELNLHTELAELPALLSPLLAGKDAGLLSEAGVPAVADPGANLVRLAHAQGIHIRPLVGPSSLLLAIMASGLNGQSFAFNGYLPTDASQRSKRIRQLEERSRNEQQTQLFIETPYRNEALLAALVHNCQPQTLLCAATDLTLESEIIVTRTIADWRSGLADTHGKALHKRPTVFLILGQIAGKQT